MFMRVLGGLTGIVLLACSVCFLAAHIALGPSLSGLVLGPLFLWYAFRKQPKKDEEETEDTDATGR